MVGGGERILRTILTACKDLGELFLDDPRDGFTDLAHRARLFLDPPKILGADCQDGCCVSVHVEEGTSAEFFDTTITVLQYMRDQHYGPATPVNEPGIQ